MKLNLKYLARLIVGGNTNHTVTVILGSNQKPTRTGSFGVSYGNRWRRLYVPSTIQISVGENWTPKIPKGMTLNTKNGVHLIRESDGMDFHFQAKEILRKDFCTWARKQMAKNYINRITTSRLEKQYQQKVGNTYVNFHDARRAGNCVTGILSWAKRKLQVNESDILSAPWLYQFPAKLLNWLDGENQLVKNSINQAYLRETAVCI